MKICAMSDMHGDLLHINPCDLVLICGDSVALKEQAQHQSCKKWYRKVFKPWAEALPCNKVLFIAGNHECGLENHEEEYYSMFSKDSKITFLFDDLYTYNYKDKEYRIYGTPWCNPFGNWAYMTSEENLKELYSQIPENLDILITHDQPYKYGDVLLQKDYSLTAGFHIGNKPLLKAIEDKQPNFQFNGHLHSCDHSKIMIGNTAHYNVSMKDELYRTVYNPLYLDI